MADTTSSIFNKKATEKLRSPDDLDKYVRVTNPSVWVVFGACVALLVGLLAWGIFGSVATSVSTTGACVDDKAICFLTAEESTKVKEGDAANVDGERMTVVRIEPTPVSVDEAHAILGSDYLVSALVKENWGYQVTFEGDTSGLAAGVPLAVNITTERIAPISLILGSR
ncbi:MAG: hypothetical protein Q4C36_00195 [Coriobacteriia bacterium]|jgi:hypothetical protein|nr:hypothetical protein [Coriobacteriia bacterium]